MDGPVGLAAGDGKAVVASTAVVAGSSVASAVGVIGAIALAMYVMRKRVGAADLEKSLVGETRGEDASISKEMAGGSSGDVEGAFSVRNPMMAGGAAAGGAVAVAVAVAGGSGAGAGGVASHVAVAPAESMRDVWAREALSVTNPIMAGVVAANGSMAGGAVARGVSSYVAATHAESTFSVTNPMNAWSPRISRTTGITYYVNQETGDTSAALPTQDAPRFIQRVSRTSGVTYFVNAITKEAVMTLPGNAVVGNRV